tara:strand:+ start:534 stop:845 length:312 start_codon:yes stop_codon:yes gene_type:complete
MGPERPVTLWDIDLPGFTLREHGWRVLGYLHGVVLARVIHPNGTIEFGTWAPDFDGSHMNGGDYVFSRLGMDGDHPAIGPVPDEVMEEFLRRAEHERGRFNSK